MASWSDIFDDHGEEQGSWEMLEYRDFQVGALMEAALQSNKYGPREAWFFSVNYVLGVGCLGVPLAIMTSG